MDKETYPIEYDVLHLNYEFISVGPKGSIKKVVRFRRISGYLFNLSFGDWDFSTGKVDDFAKSNNHDRDKVLATVAKVIFDFWEYYPTACLYAKGSTPVRTRLYQIGIVANWPIICNEVEVQGYIDREWEQFKMKKNYEAFKACIKNKH
jgi:hypothetical protein